MELGEGSTKRWIENFLTRLQQRVTINGTPSRPRLGKRPRRSSTGNSSWTTFISLIH